MGPAQLAEAALVDEIRAIWADSDGTYGSPRVCAELRRRGLVVNHKRVERLMKGHRMAGFVPRKRRVTTTADTAHRIPDLLAGDFGATRPDEAWVGDITYIRTRQGFLYLAFVLDLASRRVVGVSMASHMKASLVADALREAIGNPRRPGAGCGIPHRPRQPRRIQLVVATLGDEGGHDGCCGEGSGGGSCVAACDAVAWSSAGWAA